MIAIDTNVIVRVFIDDLNREQVEKSRNLVQKAKQVYVPQLVIAEMVWVFTRTYELSKSQIVNILHEIYENAAFLVDDKELLLKALILFKANNVDFADCMILVAAKAAGAKHLYTFDSKFSRLLDVKNLDVRH